MAKLDGINTKYKPILLLILDGWGLSPGWGGNAISMSEPENFNKLWRNYPHQVLQALANVVDPLTGTVGSSEVGHASIGTGRMVLQDLTEINEAISRGSFYNNQVLLEAIGQAKTRNSALHLIGLVSNGGVHSHIEHLFALLELAKKSSLEKVYIHVITDGYDTDPLSALGFVDQVERKIKELGIGEIATIIGRYYAMDRDNNWERIEKAYKLQTLSKGYQAISAHNAISNAYQNGYKDPFIPPTVILRDQKPVAKVENNDSVIFFNFRADRARELTRAYTDKNCFRSFALFRKFPLLKLFFVSLTSYRLPNLPIHVAFSPSEIGSSLAKIISDHGYRQLHLAESEKYAHISYFFNGGVEAPFPNEDRILVPSLKISFYAEKPEMQINQLTREITRQIKAKKYEFIVANIPNVDMVGHSGDILATQEAVHKVDEALGIIYNSITDNNGILMITADHGNAEQMNALSKNLSETKHNLNPVPFILVTPDNKKDLLASALSPVKGLLPEIISSKYSLADIAPTILEILGVAKPAEMTGKSLLGELK